MANTSSVLSRTVGVTPKRKLNQSVRTCVYFYQCQVTEQYNGRCWQEHWHPHPKGYLCHKHHMRLIANPKVSKEVRKRSNDRRNPESLREYSRKHSKQKITYKGIQIQLSFIPERLKCSVCGNQKGDLYTNSRNKLVETKLIHSHHLVYYKIFPWFGVIYLCASCHGKESWKTGQLIKDTTTNRFMSKTK